MQKEIVDAIVASLEGDAEGWSFGEYRAFHAPTRTEIWIANGRYGIHVKLGNSPEYGSVVAFPLARWRYRIYGAVHDAINRRQLKAFNDTWKRAA